MSAENKNWLLGNLVEPFIKKIVENIALSITLGTLVVIATFSVSFWKYLSNTEIALIWLIAFMLLTVIILSVVYFVLQKNFGRKLNAEINKYKTPKRVYIDIFQLDKIQSYTADEIQGIVWKWEWRKSQATKVYNPIKTIPLCPKEECDENELSFVADNKNAGKSTFGCSLCNELYTKLPSLDSIKKQIKTSAQNKYEYWSQ